MFATHKLNESGLKRMTEFKTKMSETVSGVMELMEDSREKALFKTKVEEAVYWGATAIANNGHNFFERIDYPEVSHSVK